MRSRRRSSIGARLLVASVRAACLAQVGADQPGAGAQADQCRGAQSRGAAVRRRARPRFVPGDHESSHLSALLIQSDTARGVGRLPRVSVSRSRPPRQGHSLRSRRCAIGCADPGPTLDPATALQGFGAARKTGKSKK
jgi:hypothetical protein